MNNIAAYIITTMSIDERLSNARNLQHSIESLHLFRQVEIVPAIFWKDEKSIIRFLSQNPQHSFAADYLNGCRKGQLCCSLSHINTWKKLLASDCAGAMIFEDDIYVSDIENFREIFRLLPNSTDVDWLRIHLHKKFREEIQQKESELAFIDDPSQWGFATYYTSRQGAGKLVSLFKDIDDHIDNVIPVLGKNCVLNIKTVNKALVEHSPFEGDEKILLSRHLFELVEENRQKEASTIWTSPELTSDDPLYQHVSSLSNVQELRKTGITVLKGVFDQETVRQLKRKVLKNRPLYKNTRPTPSSLHLAGFHRFPKLEPIHKLLAGNARILNFLKVLLEGKPVRSIGLSDITINRSQCWHKDLLRGEYQSFLDKETIWGAEGGGVFRLLLYLQKSSSLRIIEGSHLVPVSLEEDRHCEPEDDTGVVTVSVNEGDVAVMDIRTSHRGSPEHVFQSENFTSNPRALVATTLGIADGGLTNAMEQGNARRLKDWQERNQ